MTNPVLRQRLAELQAADTKIMQKVNAAHRESFATKFPGQLEHILRLTAERLQAGLDKRDGVDVSKPDTWRLNTHEIADLAQALYHISQVKAGLPTQE